MSGIKRKMVRSENSANIKALADGDVDQSKMTSLKRDSYSSDTVSRTSSMTSSSSSDENRVNSGGVMGKALKRKAPNGPAGLASDHDPGYDTMIVSSNYDGWTMTSSGYDTTPSDDKVYKVSVLSTTKPLVDRDEPRADFTKGLKCTDAPTALKILKTRYRLRDVNIERRPPHEIHWSMSNGFRPSYGRTGAFQGYRSVYYASDQLREISKKIFLRDLEIEEILRKILAADEQQQQAEMSEQENKEQAYRAAQTAEGKVPRVPKHTTFAPNISTAPDGMDGSTNRETDEPVAKKRRNVFQKAARAIRRRITG